MESLVMYILFAVGLALIIKGGDMFVDAASWIAKALNIPTFIIGATIVSIATTMPETLVSVIAAIDGKNDMAVGNAVGSVTANTALIMGLAMLSMTVICSREKYLKQCVMLIATAAILTLSCLGGRLNVVGSIILALIFVLFMFENVRSARKDMKSASDSAPVDRKKLGLNILLFILGAAAIVVGSRLMVKYGSEIALTLGVSERIIAITLLAIGTSLPERVTTITAIVKKESALSVGNIIGANLIDLALILPLCSLVSGEPLPVARQCAVLDIPACLIVTLVALVPIMIWQKATKLQGALLILLYAVYLVLVI